MSGSMKDVYSQEFRLPPVRYTLKDLLLGDFAFNDDGERYFDIKNNYAFNRTFRSNANDLVMHMLNNVLALTWTDRIIEVQYLEPDEEFADMRYSVIDLLCKNMRGNQLIIQMGPVHRCLGELIPFVQHYAINAYIKKIDPLEEVIFLAFIDRIMSSKNPAYRSSKVVFNIDECNYNSSDAYKNYLKKFSFTIIELPKFNKTNVNELDSTEDMWLYVFKNPTKINETDLDFIFPANMFERVYSALKIINWSYDETKAYGFEEGKQYGIEKGRKEAEMLITKRLLKAGKSVDTISECIGLPVNEIKRIENIFRN